MAMTSPYLRLINCVDLCVCMCVCVCVLVLRDCSGAGGGQARPLIGGQSLCNLCQITAITRFLLLSALMTPLHKEPGSSSSPHTHTHTHTHTHRHTHIPTVRSGSADRAGHGRPLNRERRSTSRWVEIKAGWRHRQIHTRTKIKYNTQKHAPLSTLALS